MYDLETATHKGINTAGGDLDRRGRGGTKKARRKLRTASTGKQPSQLQTRAVVYHQLCRPLHATAPKSNGMSGGVPPMVSHSSMLPSEGGTCSEEQPDKELLLRSFLGGVNTENRVQSYCCVFKPTGLLERKGAWNDC